MKKWIKPFLAAIPCALLFGYVLYGLGVKAEQERSVWKHSIKYMHGRVEWTDNTNSYTINPNGCIEYQNETGEYVTRCDNYTIQY